MKGILSLRAALWAALALAVGALLWVAGDLLAHVVIGATLAYLLQPAVDALERRGLSRSAAASGVFFGLFGAVALLALVSAPLVLSEAHHLQEQWAGGRLYRVLDQVEADLAADLPMLEPGQLGLSATARRALEDSGGQLVGYVPGALGWVSEAVVIPFVLFFLLRDGTDLRKRLIGLVPNRYFEFAMGVLFKCDEHLGGYLRSQAVVALFVAVFTAVGLGLIGVSNFIVLGILAGLANYVPYAGLIASGLAAVAVSVLTTGDFSQVPGIVVVFAVVQTLENVALQPWITGRTISLHPVTVLLAILVGERAFGVLGMTLAVPAAAILKVVVLETAVTLRRFHL